MPTASVDVCINARFKPPARATLGCFEHDARIMARDGRLL